MDSTAGSVTLNTDQEQIFPVLDFDNSMANANPERRKVVVVGDSETGKTSLLFRVTNPKLDLPKFPPTIMENQVIK